jgi:uncharacterized protein YkwD
MTFTKDQSAALAFHNKSRGEADGARRDNLTWNTSLAIDAEAYALQMAMTGNSSTQSDTDKATISTGVPAPQHFSGRLSRGLEEKPFQNGEAIPRNDEDEEAEDMKRFKQRGHYTQTV